MDILKIKGIILFVLAFFNLILAFFLWRRGKKNKVAFHLGMTAVFSAIYTIACGGTDFFWDSDYSLRLFLYRCSWLGVLVIPAYLTFLYSFTGRIKHFKLKSFLWYLVAGTIGSLALFTTYFVESVQAKYPPISDNPGMLEPFGRFYVLFGLALGLTYLLIEYFRSHGARKLRIRYFVFGNLVYAVGGIIFGGVLPLINPTGHYSDLTAFCSIFFVGLTSYAILKHRLLDIRFVLGKTAVYLSTFLVLTASAFLIIFLNSQLGSILSSNATLIVSLIVIILSFPSLFRYFEKLAARYFYYTLYTLQNTISRLSKELNQTIELEKLTNLINDSLLDALKLDRVGIILAGTEKKEKVFSAQGLINLNKEDVSQVLSSNNSFLPQYLQKTKKPLVREEIPFIIREEGRKLSEEEKAKRKQGLSLLKEQMETTEMAVFLPLLLGKQLIGVIILGDKLSDEAYTVQDLDLLTTLSSQAAIALNNALSYTEIQKRETDLEKFYNLTVGRELKMVELKKKVDELEGKLKNE